MKRARTILILLFLPAMLAGCLLTPGKFTSALDVRRNGDFSFRYAGEIVFLSPGDVMKRGEEAGKWRDDMATCFDYKPGDAKSSAEKPDVFPKPDKCTPAQVAEQRKQWEVVQTESAKRRAKEAEQFGALFGYTPGDDAANRRLAATMTKYDGWKSVTYKGEGVFDVVFEKAGRLDHDFVFPTMAQGDLIFPFVLVRRQADGSVRVSAPSLVGGAGAIAARFAAMQPGPDKENKLPSRADGVFTVTTDGVFRTNNTEDGPSTSAGGARLSWTIDPQTKIAPEALIGLR